MHSGNKWWYRYGFSPNLTFEASFRINGTMELVTVGLDNGLLPAWDHAFTQTDAELFSIGPLRKENINETGCKIQ